MRRCLERPHGRRDFAAAADFPSPTGGEPWTAERLRARVAAHGRLTPTAEVVHEGPPPHEVL